MLSRGERGGYADREVDAFLIKERDDKPSRTQGRHFPWWGQITHHPSHHPLVRIFEIKFCARFQTYVQNLVTNRLVGWEG